MDNPADPIPSIPLRPAAEQPAVSPPAETYSRRWFVWLAFGLIFLVFGIAVGVFSVTLFNRSLTQPKISSYEECVSAKGSILTQSYPSICITKDGQQKFVHPTPKKEQQDIDWLPQVHDNLDSWKTYQNSEFTFQYPDNWLLGVNGKEITSPNPQVTLWVFSSGDSMYNECMMLDETKKYVGNISVKTYSRVITGEACSGDDATSREKWIVKADGEGYAPGIRYVYKSTPQDEAETFFYQILSTFQFVE